jgi:hypothetical protein
LVSKKYGAQYVAGTASAGGRIQRGRVRDAHRLRQPPQQVLIDGWWMIGAHGAPCELTVCDLGPCLGLRCGGQKTQAPRLVDGLKHCLFDVFFQSGGVPHFFSNRVWLLI